MLQSVSPDVKNEKNFCGTFLAEVATLLLDLLLYQFCRCKPCADIGDLDLCRLSWLAALHKDYESLDSCNAVTLSAYFRDLHVVFLACFYRFGTKVAAKATA
jgi:hypothetical protein